MSSNPAQRGLRQTCSLAVDTKEGKIAKTPKKYPKEWSKVGHVGTLSTRLDEGNPTVVVSKLHDGQKSQFLKNTFFMVNSWEQVCRNPRCAGLDDD